MWTVAQVIEHLQKFHPDSLVFFQDRLGREMAPHNMVDGSVATLDVVIGVLEA